MGSCGAGMGGGSTAPASSCIACAMYAPRPLAAKVCRFCGSQANEEAAAPPPALLDILWPAMAGSGATEGWPSLNGHGLAE